MTLIDIKPHNQKIQFDRTDKKGETLKPIIMLGPRSPGQIFYVLKLITRFLNTQRLFLAIHGKNSGYLEITRKILNTRNFFGYFK